jgi:2,4-dienoyl-CoA reductase-like NADH-dependent reductase (Old Yellow Enzyme family)
MATVAGYINDAVYKIHENLAEGRVGLIITGILGVVEKDPCPGLLRIHDTSYIEGLKIIARMVHKNDSKIMAQLGHGGTQLIETPHYNPFGPFAVQDLVSGLTAKEMTQDDIDVLVEAFGSAALRVKKAGFDGIQLHGAHGYLLSKFLTPYYNRRTDKYGGSIENRTRIIVEILKNIKSECGNDFPVFIKFNCLDFLENEEGLTFEDSLRAAKIFSEAGFDALEISGGITYTEYSEARKNINSRDKEAYFKDYAVKIADSVEVPVILVGGIRSFDIMEEIIQGTKIAAVSFCRPLIKEPHLVKRWMNGDRSQSKCISCNRCLDIKDLGCFKRYAY